MKTGDLVDIVTEEMEFVARGYVTEGSSAYVRVLSTKEEKIDKSFFQKRIKNAYERRRELLQETNCIRTFFSEGDGIDRKSTRLNSSHANISYAVFCLKKK